MYSSEIGMQTVARWGFGVLGLVLSLTAFLPAEAQAPVRQVVVGPRPWAELSTDRSAEFITKPASVENLPGESFTVAKEAPTVDFAVYPEQINPIVAKPPLWSLWGEGCVAPDGCFYSAVGDHGGPDGETIIYQFDPKQKAVRRVFSFQALVGHKPGDWGFGKIHGHLDADKEGWIYFAGFWGNWPKEKDLNERYPGGVMGRYNIYSGIAEHLGSPVPGVSWPECRTDTERGLMYLLGTDSSFACYDLKAGQLKYCGSQDMRRGHRVVIVDRDNGLVYFGAHSPEGERMAKYDPALNTVALTKAFLPADGTEAPIFRAEAHYRAADGWFYCMTQAGRFFRFQPETEEIEDLGWNFGEGIYTTSIATRPGSRYLYYVPGAHGASWETGAPIVQYDTKAKQRKVIAFLEPYYESKYNYRFGGAYGLTLSEDGSTLFIPMNGNALDVALKSQAFGACSLVIILIPESERVE